MKQNQDYDDHSYAHDIQQNLKHISEVERGRKGYFCPGCGQMMIAKKGSLMLHHFAHDPNDVNRKGKCTYSDETTRHQLGKEILQRLKRIKVPALRKYPDDGEIGGVYVIRESWTVEADFVAVEMPFYENEEGKIIWGNDPTWKINSAKFLCIQPDVTFFDADGKPILLIELVATHKVDKEKYVKIRSLGVDTIQVSLPTGPSNEIEEAFHNISRTKWIYNYERENTPYKYVSPRSSKDIPLADEFERRIINFGRTYECKAFELREAIRRFRKYLESEQFTGLRKQIEQKIQRTEENTAGHRQQWQELQGTIDREVSARFESERARLDEIEAQIIIEEAEFERENEDLEQRYNLKKESLSNEERTYRATSQEEIDDVEGRIRELGANPEPLSDRIAKIRGEEKGYERSVESEEIEIDKRRERIIEEVEAIERKSIDVESETAGLGSKYPEIEKRVREENRNREERIRSEHRQFEKDLRAEFDRNRELSIGAIKDRDIGRVPTLNRKLKDIIYTGGLLKTIPLAAEFRRRMQEIRDNLEQGAY